MGALRKVILGFVMVAAGFFLFVDSVYGNAFTGIGIDWWGSFRVMAAGIVPVMLIVLGILIIWVETGDLKEHIIVEELCDSGEDELKEMIKQQFSVMSGKPGKSIRRTRDAASRPRKPSSTA